MAPVAPGAPGGYIWEQHVHEKGINVPLFFLPLAQEPNIKIPSPCFSPAQNKTLTDVPLRARCAFDSLIPLAPW
jgi:hypothetical protein